MGLASLHYAQTVGTTTLSDKQQQTAEDDTARFDRYLLQLAGQHKKPSDRLMTSRLKLAMAQAHKVDATFLAQLKHLAYATDDLAAGEALFLLGTTRRC